MKAATAGVRRETTVTTVFGAVTGRMARLSAVAAGPMPVISGAVKTRVKTVGFQVLCGATTGMFGALTAGASGAAPRLGAAAPQACCEVYQAFRDGDLGLAEEKQVRVRAAAERMEGVRGVAWSKYGCDLNGYFGGRARLPLLGLTAAEREVLEGEMWELRN